MIDRDTALNYLATDSAKILSSDYREYLFPALSHVLGYLSDDKGQMGLEKKFNDRLAGIDGVKEFEVNARLKKQKLLRRTETQVGQDLNTSLDPELSTIAMEAMQGQKGTVLISDARSGKILTLISSPSFDNNLFTDKDLSPEQKSKQQDEINRLLADPAQSMFNRSIAGSYPPGSIFKLVTALAGLESGKIDRDTSVLDEGVLKVDDFEYRSWYYWNYGKTEGEVNLLKALARSNDIYFYKVAEWVGADTLAETARQFSFGQATLLELSSQASGLVPDPKWKEETVGEKWYLGNTYHFGIGQGDLLVTPLQIQQFIQALANQGQMCQPSLLKSEPANCHNIGVKDSSLDLVLTGMMQACNQGGTAFPFFERNSRVYNEANTAAQNLNKGAVACKTGTAEFGAADEKGTRSAHGWWVGMVNPSYAKATEGMPERIVITVLVESDEADQIKEGSYDAAPVGKKILDWIEENR